jgi:hypothetical protein
MAARGFGDFRVRIAIPVMTAQQIAGADLAIENPFRAGLAFAVLEAKSGDTAAAARRLSSVRWAATVSERISRTQKEISNGKADG